MTAQDQIAEVIFAVGWPLLWAALIASVRQRRGGDTDDIRQGIGWIMLAMGAPMTAIDVSIGAWPAAACSAVNALIGAWLWWHNRRRRDRAPRFYGAKSKARVAALVKVARDAVRPRPGLRPAPGGTG